MSIAELIIHSAQHITVKQLGNFLTNHGAWAINKTKRDPDVMERLQLFASPLTFWLYSRTVTKEGIRHFLLMGHFKEEHLLTTLQPRQMTQRDEKTPR